MIFLLSTVVPSRTCIWTGRLWWYCSNILMRLHAQNMQKIKFFLNFHLAKEGGRFSPLSPPWLCSCSVLTCICKTMLLRLWTQLLYCVSMSLFCPSHYLVIIFLS